MIFDLVKKSDLFINIKSWPNIQEIDRKTKKYIQQIDRHTYKQTDRQKTNLQINKNLNKQIVVIQTTKI